MNTRNIVSLFAALCAFAVSLFQAGCAAPTSTNVTVVALQNPNNEAKAVQEGVTAAATAFLANANNKQYASELVAVADALNVIAAGNPQLITAADIAGLVATVRLSPATANQVSAIGTALLGTFNSAFAVNFPTLKPNYTIFLIAVSNGLRTATGGTAVALPVIPWPPVTPPPAAAPSTS